jgi:hypothetical protein
MVQENAPAFAEAVSKDLGKPKVEMYFAEIVNYSSVAEECYNPVLTWPYP